MASKRCRITSCQITTAGVTHDGKYSLAINEVNGEPCLCIHRCDRRGGLHYSSMDGKSLVTSINRRTLEAAIELLNGPAWRQKE